MEGKDKHSPLCVLMLIAAPKAAQKAMTLFKKGNVPVYYQFHGKGTASSEIMDILGFGNIEKTVLLSVMPKVFADKMMQKMNCGLKLNAPNSGIVFTVIISGGSSMMIHKLKELTTDTDQLVHEKEVPQMVESDYVMIMAIVNQGYSEEVMDSARKCGAAGGTVIHARQAVNESSLKFWGIRIQPEREIIIIVSPQKNKLSIMKAIGEKHGIHSEARGLVISLPVDSVVGLEK